MSDRSEIAEIDDAAITAEGSWTSAPCPWRRYGARIFDVALFGGLLSGMLGLVIGLSAPDPVYNFVVDRALWKSLLIWRPLQWMAAAPVIALLISQSTSPGKWLFAIRVRRADGSRLSLSDSILRELRLFVRGVGLALPLVSLFTMLTAYTRLSEQGHTSWDKDGNATVESFPATGLVKVRIGVGIGAVVCLLAWSIVERLRANS